MLVDNCPLLPYLVSESSTHSREALDNELQTDHAPSPLVVYVYMATVGDGAVMSVLSKIPPPRSSTNRLQ
jgi:hypothetical protein